MAKNKNENIGMTALQPTELSGSSAEARAMNPRRTLDREALLGMSAQISGSTTYSRNWKFKNADKLFPNEPLMRRVDKCFPYATGGMLLIDEPTTDRDVADCQRKADALKKEGIRYCYIKQDDEFEDVMKRLKA